MKQISTKKALLFLFCLLFVYGLSKFSVYESYEVLYPTFFSGAVTQGVPINIWYFVSHFLLAEVYMKLYSLVPHVPWYEIVLFFYVTVSLFTIITTLLRKNKDGSLLSKMIPLVVSLILATEFVVVFQYTRVAFALGIASTLLLLFGGKERKLTIWWSSFFFVVCLLTRHEVGVFIFLMQWLSAILIAPKTVSRVALVLNSLFFFFIMGYVAYDRLTTDDYLKQFEPELGYQLLDRGNIVPLGTMTNAVDSAKYIAVTNLITDQKYTTIEFLRSLVAENAFFGINAELTQRAINILSDKLDHSMGLVILYLGLLLWLFRQYISDGRKAAVKLLLFNLAFWIIIFATTYFIILQYYTLDIMLVLLCFILLGGMDFSKIRKTYLVSGLAIAILTLGTFTLYSKQQAYITRLTNDLEANKNFGLALKKKYPGKIIVPGNEQKKMILFSLRPYQMHDFSTFSKFYLFDADVIYIQDNYNAYLRKECSCNAKDYIEFMDYLASKKDSVRIISSPDRIDVIKYYCKVVRNKDYNIVPIDSISVDGDEATVFTFL